MTSKTKQTDLPEALDESNILGYTAYMKIRDQKGMFIDQTARYCVIEPDETRQWFKPTQIKQGDRILLQKDLIRSSKRDIAKQLAKEFLRTDINLLKEWVVELNQSVSREKLNEFHQTYEEHVRKYHPKTPPIVYTTLLNWYEDRVYFPNRYDQLRIIAGLLENGRLRSIVDNPRVHMLKRDIVSKLSHIVHTLLSDPSEVVLKEKPIKHIPEKRYIIPSEEKVSVTKTPKHEIQEFDRDLAKVMPKHWIDTNFFIGTVEEIKLIPIQRKWVKKRIPRKHRKTPAGYTMEETAVIEFGGKLLQWEDRHTTYVESLQPISLDALAPRTHEDFSDITGQELIAYIERQKSERGKLDTDLRSFNTFLAYFMCHTIRFIAKPPTNIEAKIYAHVARYFAQSYIALTPRIFLLYMLIAPKDTKLLDSLYDQLYDDIRPTEHRAHLVNLYNETLKETPLQVFPLPPLIAGLKVPEDDIINGPPLMLGDWNVRDGYGPDVYGYVEFIDNLYWVFILLIETLQKFKYIVDLKPIPPEAIAKAANELRDTPIFGTTERELDEEGEPHLGMFSILSDPDEIVGVLRYFRQVKITFLEFSIRAESEIDKKRRKISKVAHQKFYLMPRQRQGIVAYDDMMLQSVYLWWSHCRFDATTVKALFDMITTEDDEKLLAHLNEIKSRIVTHLNNIVLIRQKPCNSCVFNENEWHKSCVIHNLDPLKCPTYLPFWAQNELMEVAPSLKKLSIHDRTIYLAGYFGDRLRDNYTTGAIPRVKVDANLKFEDGTEIEFGTAKEQHEFFREFAQHVRYSRNGKKHAVRAGKRKEYRQTTKFRPKRRRRK